MEERRRVVLHVCCAPCASASVERLAAEGYETILFYSNSNILSKTEFEKRLESVQRLADSTDAQLIVDPYDHKAWLKAVPGLEDEPEGGRRCRQCFRFSLGRTADKALEFGTGLFTTTLTISPHKNSGIIFDIGKELAAIKGSNKLTASSLTSSPLPCLPALRFLQTDFKKRDGFLRSTGLAKQHGFYRQNFCGCEFSFKQQEKK